MLVLRTPKGWTGPKEIDGKKVEDFWRSHQVPFSDVGKGDHLKLLEEWLKSYGPDELFDENGTFHAELKELAPKGTRRLGSNPHANGGALMRDLRLPDFRDYAVDCPTPGATIGEATKVLGDFLRDVKARIKEVSTLLYAFRREDLFKALPLLTQDNRQREFYLPDVLNVLMDKGELVSAIPAAWQWLPIMQ